MKRNSLTTAVLAGLTGVAGMAGVANAVNVNPDGLGQVLLFPYYTARGGNDTLISIVNTTDRGKAVKIRFIEALNSREVLDFNIYMSPFDVWTGAVTAEGEGAKIVTTDTTCTVPYFVGDSEDGIGEQAFLPFQYNSEPVDTNGDGDEDFPGTLDGGPIGVERTASGYIEIIEMGTLLEQPDADYEPDFDDLTGEVIPWAVKHVGGVPRNCDVPVLAWTQGADLPWEDGDNTTFGFDTERGATGGLYGAASIVNPAEGTLFSYNATAINGFWVAGTTNHTTPGSLAPSLSTADSNNESNVFTDDGTVQTLTWDPANNPHLALNAALTVETLMNEYMINDDLLADTEWVLTFPTKRYHTDDAEGGPNPDLDAAIQPFTDLWSADPDREDEDGFAFPKPVGSCEVLTFRVWDREEGPDPETPDDPDPVLVPPDVSPPPPPQPGEPPERETPFQLCREANVMRFVNDGTVPAETEILGEPLREGDFESLSYTNVNLEGFSEGWVRFDFGSRYSVASGEGLSVPGLPVIGFSVTTFNNGTLPDGVLANYGGSFQHRGTRGEPVVSTAD